MNVMFLFFGRGIGKAPMRTNIICVRDSTALLFHDPLVLAMPHDGSLVHLRTEKTTPLFV